MALGKTMMYSLNKNVLNDDFIIHHKLDKELKVDNTQIHNHIVSHNKITNPFFINWEVNIGRIFQLQMELYDADYSKFTSLLSLNAILIKKNKL